MPASPSRADQTKSKLLAAAAVALSEGGGAFELQQVALHAGVSIGLVSHHFGSKAGLIGAVVNRFYDEAEQALDLCDSAAQDWSAREGERLSRLIAFFYREDLAAIILSKLTHDPEVAAIETQRWNGLIDVAARNIIKGQARGQISGSQRADVLAAMIVGAARHAIARALASPRRPTQTQLAAAIWAFITSGLQLEAGTASVLPFQRKSKNRANQGDSE